MNRIEQNGFIATASMADLQEEVGLGAPDRNGKAPFVPQKEKPKPSLRDNGRLLLIGAGIVLVLLLLAFNGISHRSSPTRKKSAKNLQSQNTMQSEDRNATSITPILEAGRSPEQNTDTSRVGPDQIGRLATTDRTEAATRSLGDVRPFGNTQAWQPAPYQPGSEAATMPEAPAESVEAQGRSEREVRDNASLVFVRNNTPSPTPQKSEETIPQMDFGIGLAPGTRLRAKLESAISTAVQTPVIAVIQYNYERNGEIVIPAGAKAFGHLEVADRSGFIGIHFDSLLLPDGSTVNLEAEATDLQIRPLRGKVEGEHAGKNLLVRSLAGVGEITATLVGRGNLNQPLSENDLLRERVSSNIGQASDQSIANLALTERIVVSVPAGTEIYVILQKAAKEKATNSSHIQLPMQTEDQPTIDDLRQLIQLQRELSQTIASRPVE